MPQAKKKPAPKKPVAAKTTAKKPVAAKRTTSAPTKKTAVAVAAKNTSNASSALAWALLGIVVIAFAVWLLSQYTSSTDAYNSIDETNSAAAPAASKKAADHQ